MTPKRCCFARSRNCTRASIAATGPRSPNRWNCRKRKPTPRRAERRTLIANNKAWDTSTRVRKEWIGALLTRKKLPTDAAAFVAVTLTRHAYDLSADNNSAAATYLGHEGYAAREALAAMVETTPTKAAYVSLAVALSARENRTNRESWRTPNSSDEAYLLQIEKWGHKLSAVERIAAGYPAPETIEEAADTDTE